MLKRSVEDEYFNKHFCEMYMCLRHEYETLVRLGCPIDNPVMRLLRFRRHSVVGESQNVSLKRAATEPSQKRSVGKKRVKTEPMSDQDVYLQQALSRRDYEMLGFNVFNHLIELDQAQLLCILKDIYSWRFKNNNLRKQIFKELLEYLGASKHLLTGSEIRDKEVLLLYKKMYKIIKKTMVADERKTLLAELFKSFHEDVQRNDGSVRIFVSIIRSDEAVRKDMTTFAKYAEVTTDWHPVMMRLLTAADKLALKTHYMGLMMGLLKLRLNRARTRELQNIRKLTQWAFRLNPRAENAIFAQSLTRDRNESIRHKIRENLVTLRQAPIGSHVPTVLFRQLQTNAMGISHDDRTRQSLLRQINRTRQRFLYG